MDSNSRSASPREPARPQHRPPSPPTPTAFDNRAYQHDDADPNHNDSFTSNVPQQNGHSKESNGDTKTLEAVNLELINLTPKNGNAKKKDAVELDMSTSNPYDEYFVPVNEHRKYMRGEKLYVTADKRGEKGGCKRPLCWTLLALVAAVIVALIVLAATGILFSSSPTTVEQYNSSLSSARAFGGLAHDHSQHEHNEHDHADLDHAEHNRVEHDHNDLDHDHGMAPEPGTLNDEGRSLGGDDGDSSLYVPRTIEGEVKIDNEVFTPQLRDTESPEYRELTATFSDALKRALFDRNTIERGDNDITVEVIKLREGSVIVRYRIHWKPKSGSMEVTDNLLTPESLQSNLNNYLDRNNRMISTFHIAEDIMSTRPVLDICKISKYDCEHECVFDENTLDFLCTCPAGYIIDMTNLKKCVPLLGNSNEQEIKGIELNSNPVTTKPIPEEEKSNTESVQVSNSNLFDWKETSHEIPETTTQSEPDVSFSHIFGNSHESTTLEPRAEPKPEPVPAAEPKPEPEPTSEPEPEAKPASEPKPEPEPTSEPAPEPTAQPEPVSSEGSNLKVAPLAEPEPASEPLPTAEPAPEPEPNPEPAPEPEPNPEPAPEPKPTAEPTPNEPTSGESFPEPESKAEPQADNTQPSISAEEPVAEPTAEPEPTTSVLVDDINLAHNYASETVTGLGFEPQPKSEPNGDLATSFEIKTETPNNHASSEQTVLTEHNFMNIESEPTTETDTSSRMETIQEDKPDIEESTTTTRISISEPNIINEPSYEPKPEIISILSDTKLNTGFQESTTNSDWLENSKILNQSSVDNMNNVLEQRSFNSIINELLEETTTEKATGGNKTDISFLDIQNYDIPTTTGLPEVEISENKETTTLASISERKNIINIPLDINTTVTNDEIQETNNTDVTTQIAIIEEAEKKQDDNSDKMSTVFQIKSEKSNENTSDTEETTVQVEPKTEYSIKNQFLNEEASVTDMLLNALTNKEKAEIPIETTTVINTIDDATDITFDNINKLNQLNRSSKSFESNNTTIIESTELTPNDSFTTDSEWLSVPVTEINYDQVINNAEKETTTHVPMTNIEAVINHGLLKDDFEPDYFTSIGSTKSTDDIPLYGITHDYDNEDSRVKRVDNVAKEDSMTGATEKIMMESSSKPVETTTISRYIYEKTEQHISNDEQQNETTTESTNLKNSNPAPVWEESEVERETVKETPKSEIMTSSEMTTTTTTSTQVPTTSITENIEEGSNITDETIESLTNSTRLNNLDVTVYEVSSHNNSLSSSTSNLTNTHSAEYDEHEIDMNPFLPEVENNKHLVKKLQEGHDLLDPNNLNDTQNDNGEEHSSVVLGGQISQTNNSINVHTNNDENISTSENKLNATQQDMEENKEPNKENSSTFLEDTEDLLFPDRENDEFKGSKTSTSMYANENLSVVPIAQEKLELKALKKDYESKNLQGLNDISDSPKKSDKRTLEVNKLESVSNNEA